MVHFINHYFYGHLPSMMKIYNPEETISYARPASVIINSNNGLKCSACRGTTPSNHHQTFFTEYTDTILFGRMLTIFQLKNAFNKYLQHGNYCPSSQNTWDLIFNTWQIKVQFRSSSLPLVQISVINHLVHNIDFVTCTRSVVFITLVKKSGGKLGKLQNILWSDTQSVSLISKDT